MSLHVMESFAPVDYQRDPDFLMGSFDPRVERRPQRVRTRQPQEGTTISESTVATAQDPLMDRLADYERKESPQHGNFDIHSISAPTYHVMSSTDRLRKVVLDVVRELSIVRIFATMIQSRHFPMFVRDVLLFLALSQAVLAAFTAAVGSFLVATALTVATLMTLAVALAAQRVSEEAGT